MFEIFVITHRTAIPEFYYNDKDFETYKNNFKFINVSNNKVEDNYFSYIDLQASSNFIPLGKYYAEWEAIYNIYKNKMYTKEYIGFLHYDKELLTFNNETNVLFRINKFITENRDKKIHISFQNHSSREMYNQNILADVNQPNVQEGKGMNCFDYILNDYNNFFKTNYTIDDVLAKGQINMCSTFLVKVDLFEKMMLWISDVIQSKKLEVFDTNHQYRQQGGLLERYASIFLNLEQNIYNLDLSIYHRNLK
jgi:hypothetical protein